MIPSEESFVNFNNLMDWSVASVDTSDPVGKYNTLIGQNLAKWQSTNMNGVSIHFWP